MPSTVGPHVKRYTVLVPPHTEGELLENPDGQLVAYDDYKKLENKYMELLFKASNPKRARFIVSFEPEISEQEFD